MLIQKQIFGLSTALLLAFAGIAAAPAARAQEKPSVFDAEQSEAIGELVRQYILDHPEVLLEALQIYEQRQQAAAADTLAQLIEEDPNLRLVMKEFPILSAESLMAARAALAAQNQGKYESFHFALMEGGGGFTEDEIMAVADSVGLDVAQLQADMQDPEIEAALRRNNSLAERIGVTGTPAFVVGDTLLTGATSLEQLRALIAEARAKAS